MSESIVTGMVIKIIINLSDLSEMLIELDIWFIKHLILQLRKFQGHNNDDIWALIHLIFSAHKYQII